MDISIIITAYNYENYIRECVESCINQKNTTLNFEVIVVDDGSTDDTPKVLEDINYPNLRKFRINNSGIEQASNFGFEKALGKYVVRVDADDRLSNNYLKVVETQISAEYVFYYSDYLQIDSCGAEEKKVKLPAFNKEEIFTRGDFLATGTLYSKKALLEVGYYSIKEKNTGLENFELILKLILSGAIGKHIPSYLFSYRRHRLNLSELKREQIIKNGVKMFKNMNLGEFKTNQYHPYGLIL